MNIDQRQHSIEAGGPAFHIGKRQEGGLGRCPVCTDGTGVQHTAETDDVYTNYKLRDVACNRSDWLKLLQFSNVTTFNTAPGMLILRLLRIFNLLSILLSVIYIYKYSYYIL